MRQFVIIGICGATLLLAQPRAAASDGVALDARLCRPAPTAVLAPLPREWPEGGKYSQLCPVPGKDKKAVLYVLTHRLDLAGLDYPFMENVIKNGYGVSDTSIIMDSNFQILREYEGNFSFDPPDTLHITFLDWRGNFPHRIEFFAPAGDIHGPEFNYLYWNPLTLWFQDLPLDAKGRP